MYTSTNPLAYPISAYSYILVQCAPNSARSTCISPYTNQGIANTLAKFMSYVACAGQIHMSAIGYAPLPPQLSQFLADAVGYMLNQPAQQLNASNCSNPTFSGNLGADCVSTTGAADRQRARGCGRKQWRWKVNDRRSVCDSCRRDHRVNSRFDGRDRKRTVWHDQQCSDRRELEVQAGRSRGSRGWPATDEPVAPTPCALTASRRPCRHLVHQTKA